MLENYDDSNFHRFCFLKELSTVLKLYSSISRQSSAYLKVSGVDHSR